MKQKVSAKKKNSSLQRLQMVSASGSSHPRKNSWYHEAVTHCVSEMKQMHIAITSQET
jgi:hypothetical protein